MTESGFKFTPKKTGLAAVLDSAKRVEGLIKKDNPSTKAIEFVYAKPEEVSDRIRIIFDDSGSMTGQKIEDAKDGCVEFMRNCTINQTAVSIHPLCTPADSRLTALTTNLPVLSAQIKAQYYSMGSTPLFETWKKAQKMEPRASRYVIFSDGSPDNTKDKEECIAQAIEQRTPCDTVYITSSSAYENYNDSAENLLKEIAQRTGGIFLRFDRNKVNFKTAFKYLAPGLRLALAASVSMQKDLQEGRLK